MDCRTFCRKLEDHLEGGLDFPGRFGMERHAEQCFQCGKVYTDALRLRRLAQTVQKVRAPENFEAAVLARIQAQGGRGRHAGISWFRFHDLGRLRPHALAFGAVAALLLVLGIFLFQDPDASNPAVSSWPADTREGGGALSPEEWPSISSGVADRSSFTPDWVLEREGEGGGFPDSPVWEGLQSEWEWPAELRAGGAGDYVEFVIPGPGNSQWIMRLPKTIRMRHAQPSEEHFIRNVSH